MNQTKISFKIDGEPKGKGRPRFGNSSTYTPTETKDYETQVGWCYKAVSRGFQFSENDAIRVEIIAHFGIPKSTSKVKREAMLQGKIRPLKKCDADNIAKIICDGLNGVAYPDDKQITSLSVEKMMKKDKVIWSASWKKQLESLLILMQTHFGRGSVCDAKLFRRTKRCVFQNDW